MEPASKSIKGLIDQFMAGDIQLPEIRREYVWSREKACPLIDSIYKGYPSGSILLWRTDMADAARPAAATDADSSIAPSHLLLDGQQRLTSLAAVMKGTPVAMRVRGSVVEARIEVYFNMDHPDAAPEPDDTDGDADYAAGDSRIFQLRNRKAESDRRWISVTSSPERRRPPLRRASRPRAPAGRACRAAPRCGRAGGAPRKAGPASYCRPIRPAMPTPEAPESRGQALATLCPCPLCRASHRAALRTESPAPSRMTYAACSGARPEVHLRTMEPKRGGAIVTRGNPAPNRNRAGDTDESQACCRNGGHGSGASGGRDDVLLYKLLQRTGCWNCHRHRRIRNFCDARTKDCCRHPCCRRRSGCSAAFG